METLSTSDVYRRKQLNAGRFYAPLQLYYPQLTNGCEYFLVGGRMRWMDNMVNVK